MKTPAGPGEFSAGMMGGGDKNLADQVQEGQRLEALMHAIYHPLSNLDPPAWVTSAIQYFSIRPSLKIA